MKYLTGVLQIILCAIFGILIGACIKLPTYEPTSPYDVTPGITVLFVAICSFIAFLFGIIGCLLGYYIKNENNSES